MERTDLVYIAIGLAKQAAKWPQGFWQAQEFPICFSMRSNSRKVTVRITNEAVSGEQMKLCVSVLDEASADSPVIMPVVIQNELANGRQVDAHDDDPFADIPDEAGRFFADNVGCEPLVRNALLRGLDSESGDERAFCAWLLAEGSEGEKDDGLETDS